MGWLVTKLWQVSRSEILPVIRNLAKAIKRRHSALREQLIDRAGAWIAAEFRG
jgi:hypothetical protein